MQYNNRIKVLQLGSPTGLYGAERWIIALIKHLDPQKIESIVGVIKDDPTQNAPLCKEAKKLGFKTHLFEAHGKVNLAAIKKIKKFILQNGIDILHTHFYKADLIGLLATHNTKCKIISTPHGWSKQMDSKLWCYELLDRFIFTFMDAVAPLSNDLYTSLRKNPVLKKRLHIINNGVDISEIDSTNEVNQDFSSMKQEGFFIIGYIGQLIQRKGLDVLLKAASQLQNLKWKIAIVGEGGQKEELKKMADQLNVNRNVFFLGYKKDRLSFLKGFDVFVLPSRLEGIPRCLMEALAAKVPVIASDIPGSTDLIENEKTGLLFAVDDPKSLKRAIERMVSDRRLRKTITANGRKYIDEKFSAQRMADEYQNLFISL